MITAWRRELDWNLMVRMLPRSTPGLKTGIENAVRGAGGVMLLSLS